jgi:hypothetical protein
MKRKAQARRHKPAEIKQAVARIQAGEPLSKVAQEFGVSKSLASYWVERADKLVPSAATPSALSPKSALRTRRFIERCAATIELAFERLKAELKSDAPKSVKDLGLLIAVLYDKQAQAAQRLEAQAPRSAQDWSASEDTLLILRRHREGGVAPTPAENVVEARLEPSPLEPQKKAAAAEAVEAETPPPEPEKPRRGAVGVP